MHTMARGPFFNQLILKRLLKFYNSFVSVLIGWKQVTIRATFRSQFWSLSQFVIYFSWNRKLNGLWILITNSVRFWILIKNSIKFWILIKIMFTINLNFTNEVVEHNQRILDPVLRQRKMKNWEGNRLFYFSDNGAPNNW